MSVARSPITPERHPDYVRSHQSLPEFNLFFNPENQIEEEVAEAMGEPTMKVYMMKTQEDYGSGIARPKINDKAHFELKGQLLKELRDNTFSGSDNEDANKHIEKVLEIEVILFYKELDAPTRQILHSKGAIPFMKVADAKKAIQDMDCPIKEEGKIFEEAYYTQFGVPFPQGGRYKAAASGFYQRDNGNPSYQERRQTMEELMIKFMAESAKRHDEKSNLIKEIRVATDATIRNQGASIKALEIQIRQMSKEALKSLLMDKPRMGYQIEASMNVHNSAILEDSLPPKEKYPRSFTIPCYINNICFEKSLADLRASGWSPTYGDYIELNDLNEPLELRRNQVEDLGLTIEDGAVTDKPMIEVTKTRNEDKEIEGIDEYPSFFDFDRKIHMDRAYNLQFSCMIVIETMDAYHDEGIGDVIVGKPFCQEICVKAKRFDGMITIYNGNSDVTYQMARSHP
ncbi:hypothetical protein Tco_1060189, partial [Tanacetum coccineum]